MDSLVTRPKIPSPCGDGGGVLSNKTNTFFLDNWIARMVVLYIKPWFYMDGLEGRTKRRGQKSGTWFRQ